MFLHRAQLRPFRELSPEIAAEAKDYPRNWVCSAACSMHMLSWDRSKHGAWERDFLGYGTSDKTRERKISTANTLGTGWSMKKVKKICFGTAGEAIEKGVLRAAHTYTGIIRECPPPPGGGGGGLLMQYHDTCLLSAGRVYDLLDCNYNGNWVWVGFEIIPSGPLLGLSNFIINILFIFIILLTLEFHNVHWFS